MGCKFIRFCMTGGIIFSGDYCMSNGRFRPFEHICGTSMVKYVIEKLRKEGIGYIVVVTGFRRNELERHLYDEGVNCVEDSRYYMSSYIDKLRLGVGSLLSTLDEAIIIDLSGKRNVVSLSRECFETILFEPDENNLEDYLSTHMIQKDLYIPENRSSDASAVLVIDGNTIDNELISLLELINDSGSISHAASAIGMSYTKAWKKLRNHPRLLDKQVGGKSGGGSTLSSYAQNLVKNYKQLQKELDNRLDQLFEKHFPI